MHTPPAAGKCYHQVRTASARDKNEKFDKFRDRDRSNHAPIKGNPMKAILSAMTIYLVSGCAENSCIDRTGKPIQSQTSSYKFNAVEVSDGKGTKIFAGSYFVENGFQTWTITSNNISNTYSSFVVDHRKYRGNECEAHPISQKVNGQIMEHQLYICNDGKDIYQVFADATIHFYNAPTDK